MRLLAFVCIFILAYSAWCIAEEHIPERIILKGFLGKEELAEARQILEQLQAEERQKTLIIEINSSSGDLIQVLEIAKSIYELKILKSLKVIIYLDDNAIGAAAILPFLADELYCSLFVSWGDIALGSEKSLPTNILRNRVRSLISPQNPHARLLHLLADAMSDADMQIVEDQEGWKLARDVTIKDSIRSFISAPGQALVINQNQLKDLGLVVDILTPQQFQARYHFQPESPPPQEEKSSSVLVFSAQNVEEKLQKYIHFSPSGPNQIGYIFIGDHETSINQSTWLYVKQALDHYKQSKPIFIILELNTPGGEVFAAQKISDALKEIDIQYQIPIVVFINNWAISAGAMLAYSCRFIAVTKDSSMGAAEPVYAGEGGKMEVASEKVNSAIRADFANRARFFDRNSLIAEAMVDKDMILVLRHGRVIKLDNESQIRLTGPDSDLVISPKGKLLTLDAERLMAYGVADLLLLPKHLPPITPEEQSQGQWPANKMLLFQIPFFAQIPQANIQAYQMDWKTRFFVWLATPLVSSLLFMGLLIGAYMELNNPGLSLPGGIAATCLFLIILSSFSLQIADWLELILLLTGLILFLVELFILPTFGLLGFIGAILFIIGLFGMMLPGIGSVSFEYDTKTLNAAGQYFLERLAWLSGSFVLSSVVIALLARYITPTFAGFKRFILAGHEQNASEGFFAGFDPQTLPQPGAKGEVLAPLRPAGKINIQDHVYDAVSTGDFIEAGETIVVVRLEGGLIVVSRFMEEGNI